MIENSVSKAESRQQGPDTRIRERELESGQCTIAKKKRADGATFKAEETARSAYTLAQLRSSLRENDTIHKAGDTARNTQRFYSHITHTAQHNMVIQAEDTARRTCCGAHFCACLTQPMTGWKDFCFSTLRTCHYVLFSGFATIPRQMMRWLWDEVVGALCGKDGLT